MNTIEPVIGALITPQQIGRNYLFYLSQSKTVRWLKPMPLKEGKGSSSPPHISVSMNLLGGLQLAKRRCSLGRPIDSAACWHVYAIPFQEALQPPITVEHASERWLIPLHGVSSYVGVPIGTLLLYPLHRAPQFDLEGLLQISSEVSIPLNDEIILKRGYYGTAVTCLTDQSYKLQDLWPIEQSLYVEKLALMRPYSPVVEKAQIPVWHW